MSRSTVTSRTSAAAARIRVFVLPFTRQPPTCAAHGIPASPHDYFPLLSSRLHDRDEYDSRARIYRLRTEPMAGLKAWLEETEALWGRQLVALKAHLQKSRK